MGDRIMPSAPDIEWWRKLAAKVEFGWQLGPGAIYPARKWLFDCDGAFVRKYRGYHVWWLRGWVRVCGLEVGAGVFWRGLRIAEATPSDNTGSTQPQGAGASNRPGEI